MDIKMNLQKTATTAQFYIAGSTAGSVRNPNKNVYSKLYTQNM